MADEQRKRNPAAHLIAGGHCFKPGQSGNPKGRMVNVRSVIDIVTPDGRERIWRRLLRIALREGPEAMDAARLILARTDPMPRPTTVTGEVAVTHHTMRDLSKLTPAELERLADLCERASIPTSGSGPTLN